MGAADSMYLAMQHATVPNQFGAVLSIETASGVDVSVLIRTLEKRLTAIPRMRQRAMRVPWGCGRPVWIDDASFIPEQHLRHVVCSPLGDESSLLAIAAGLLIRPLRVDRPLWSATVVTGLTDGRVALILVVQHALADGIGGLAVLDALVDGAAAPGTCRTFPLPPPSISHLAADAMLDRLHALTRGVGRIRRALKLTRIGDHPRIGRAARCSLTKPAGGDRRLAVTRMRTDDVLSAAHRHDATVNDILLSAIGGTLGRYLAARGEHPDAVVLGIPVGMRDAATVADMGNRASEIRVAIPTAGAPLARLDRVAHTMRVSKRAPMGPMTIVIASVVIHAALAVGIYEWYMRRQRYLHSVVTNVHGPDRQLTVCGAPVTDILPLAVGGGGNVKMIFAALSYAGTLAIAVIADPDIMPELAGITAALDTELHAVLQG